MTKTEQELKDMETIADATDIAGRVARILMTGMQLPEFGEGSPTVNEVAKIMGKDATFVREGIEAGWLPIGVCGGKSSKRNFYISPKKLWEVTGHVWRGRNVS